MNLLLRGNFDVSKHRFWIKQGKNKSKLEIHCQDFYSTKLFYDFLMLWWQIDENEHKLHGRKIKPHCKICIDKEESIIS